jgi:hypothetical protein
VAHPAEDADGTGELAAGTLRRNKPTTVNNKAAEPAVCSKAATSGQPNTTLLKPVATCNNNKPPKAVTQARNSGRGHNNQQMPATATAST